MDFESLWAAGNELASKQFFHAALEHWAQVAESGNVMPEQLAFVHDEIGKVYIQLANPPKALEYFSRAVDLTDDAKASALYHMHMAMTYGLLAKHDLAQRLMNTLIPHADSGTFPPLFCGRLYNNLAYFQGHNEFYHEAINHTLRSLEYFQQAGQPQFEAGVYTNLGFLYIELNQLDDAQQCLTTAVQLSGGGLPALTELCRLHWLKGEIEDSVAYAKQALTVLWSSFINYEKEEIARLCRFFAQLAFQFGEKTTALRLLEKSQLFFGQLRLWREWQQAQSRMDDWESQPALPLDLDAAQVLAHLNQFISLLDAMNAQEILHERYSALLDTRVLYTLSLAQTLGVPEEKQQTLVFACRFADYGLTAIEPEVVLNPARSPQAHVLYQQHPVLSVKMLQDTGLSEEVFAVIFDHHECFDGSGYPQKKTGETIHPLARIFAVADRYASNVVLHDMSHSDAVANIKSREKEFDPAVVQTFIEMFHAFQPNLTGLR
ncbi:HD domain-containing protein [Alicyclobacillus tolerans]|uniref:HD domain-containing phosphohydrolase n=1 Tax=Alicyclobacillus tolerans TaxID=90970 RepID=UPI001F3C9E9C|nr:HD domain-containing phosphohydrolase [Alicyclobacillus tolerans]MCF8564072.1 HD domain-containing protein [Alicyclobacillus tolerans]